MNQRARIQRRKLSKQLYRRASGLLLVAGLRSRLECQIRLAAGRFYRENRSVRRPHGGYGGIQKTQWVFGLHFAEMRNTDQGARPPLRTAQRPDCLVGHVGFEPANPSAGYLT